LSRKVANASWSNLVHFARCVHERIAIVEPSFGYGATSIAFASSW
jgi:hypothetical protein